MRRLVYHSTAVFSSPAEANTAIRDILRASERNNPPLGVTGMLLFENGVFLQVLEGPRAAVSQTLFKISKDPRHKDVVVDECTPITERQFSSFNMGALSGLNPRIRQQLQRYLDEAADPGTALNLLMGAPDPLENAETSPAALRAGLRAGRMQRLHARHQGLTMPAPPDA